MSGKGYSALPTEEPRDSVDMESPVASASEAYRDEPDYEEAHAAPSDRLLPANGTDYGEGSARKLGDWLKIASRRIRSWPKRIGSRYHAFRKTHSRRSILLTGLIGFLLASTIGLATSTGVLAVRLRHRHFTYVPAFTRIPWNHGSGVYSKNFNLDLQGMYPPLAKDAEPSCKQAWTNMRVTRCHEKVLNRAWDNGRQLSIFEPRYDLYAGPLCDQPCIRDLESNHELISSQCTSKDLFDISEQYVGPLTADPYLEESPIAMLHTLLARVRHSCRKQPSTGYYWDEHVPCPAELYQDWFIVDGMNAGNLNGLDVFEKGTNKASGGGDPDGHDRAFPPDFCDEVSAPNDYVFRPFHRRTKGPSDGATFCSWCLINWFDRKLQSWEEDKVFDPVNGSTLSLPQYLRRIEHAGRRCQSHDWDRIYKKNIWMYQEKGLLSDDWDKSESHLSGAHPSANGLVAMTEQRYE